MMDDEVVELDHDSPRIGHVRFDPRKQRRGRPDIVMLEIVKESRIAAFDKDIVRPLVHKRRAASNGNPK